MSKATERREHRLARDLRALATRNPAKFVRGWNLYLKGLCEEVVARRRGLTRGKEGVSLSSVYWGFEKAQRLLAMIGAEAERLVGPCTRQVLDHECCKAVAAATDGHLYLFEEDSVYGLMMTKRSV